MLPLAQLNTVDLNANGWEANNGRKTPQLQGSKEEIDLKNTMIVGARKVTGKQEDVHQLWWVDNLHLQYKVPQLLGIEVACKAKATTAEVRGC
jgi:hypothetical protein